jgi:hypothetical protein
MGVTPDELMHLAAQLRLAVPQHAPLRVAELVQHCVVRLEYLARVSGPEQAKMSQHRHATQLLQLCRDYTAPPSRAMRFDE